MVWDGKTSGGINHWQNEGKSDITKAVYAQQDKVIKDAYERVFGKGAGK